VLDATECRAQAKSSKLEEQRKAIRKSYQASVPRNTTLGYGVKERIHKYPSAAWPYGMSRDKMRYFYLDSFAVKILLWARLATGKRVHLPLTDCWTCCDGPPLSASTGHDERCHDGKMASPCEKKGILGPSYGASSPIAPVPAFSSLNHKEKGLFFLYGLIDLPAGYGSITTSDVPNVSLHADLYNLIAYRPLFPSRHKLETVPAFVLPQLPMVYGYLYLTLLSSRLRASLQDWIKARLFCSGLQLDACRFDMKYGPCPKSKLCSATGNALHKGLT
jgi:hypothetical protein